MKKAVFFFLLSGTVVMIAVMSITGASLKTAATPKGILDLEFAYNTTKAKAVLDAWTKDANQASFDKISAAVLNTKLDFIFLFFYSLFLYSCCNSLATFFKPARSAGGRAVSVKLLNTSGIFFAKAAITAGLLDILENIGMLITLGGNLSGTTTMLTVIFSVIKWMLALLSVLYVLVAGVIWILKKTRQFHHSPK